MCEFLSWIELPNGELRYISNYELNTREGQRLKKSLGPDFRNEIVGHGAIKEFFGLRNHAGKDRECFDFSDPNNFPKEIIRKIKKGEFSQIGICTDLLTPIAWEEYNKIEQTAWEEYDKIKRAAFWKLFADPRNRIEAWR